MCARSRLLPNEARTNRGGRGLGLNATCITNSDWQLSLHVTRIEAASRAISDGAAHPVGAPTISGWLDDARDAWCVAHQAAVAYKDALAEIDAKLNLVERRLQWEQDRREAVTKVAK